MMTSSYKHSHQAVSSNILYLRIVQRMMDLIMKIESQFILISTIQSMILLVMNHVMIVLTMLVLMT